MTLSGPPVVRPRCWAGYGHLSSASVRPPPFLARGGFDHAFPLCANRKGKRFMSVVDADPYAQAKAPSQAEHYRDLGAVEREAFRMISRGVADRRHAFHTPVLATHGVDGFPAARTLVLRGFDPRQRTLIFHTDRRSGKVGEIAANARVAIAFYDATSKIQIRVAGFASLHSGDAVSDVAYARLSAWSRRCYLGAPPGTHSSEPTSGLPQALETRAPTATESAAGSANLAVICVQVSRLEWLYLAAQGHRRAALTWDEQGKRHAEWLTP